MYVTQLIARESVRRHLAHASQTTEQNLPLTFCPSICKISGVVAQVPKPQWTADDLAPVVNHGLDSFGPDRVVFGSDWPVCRRGAELGAWITALRQIVSGRAESEQRKLFHDSAQRFYLV